ncbi:MAG: serine/threonine-protein kinase, partial [Acidimicrobiales bacterium]
MADPERIGRYLVQGALGSGSFATVFLALDELLDQQVAIKVLADNWARNADTRRRFIEEAKILRRVDHDRVVRVHTVDELPDGRPYFVMTYADRGTLEARLAARRLERRPFELGEAVAIVTEIGECLSVIHELGVVHRDLKPSNVLLRTGRGPRGAAPVERIVLGDFGLAKDLAAASGFTLAAGTPAYMAPEQASLSDELDHRADLFALTAVLFELLTGRPPFAAVTMSDVRRAHERHHQPLLVEVRPELPAALQAVIDKGLQVAPSERHQSAEELVGELAAAAGAAPAGTAGAALAGTAAAGPVGQAGAASALEAELRGLFEALRAAAQSDGDRAVVEQACARLEGPVRVLVLAGVQAHEGGGR